MNTPISGLAAALLAVGMVLPAGAAAQSAQNSQMTNGSSYTNANGSSGWRAEAREMVTTRAAIDRTLDAKDAHPGQEFKAKIYRKVELKNGTELPAGTVLIGKVATDDMNQSGKSKLALCIDQAQLQDGKTIPLKAMITGVYGPGSGVPHDYPVLPGHQEPNVWTSKTDQIDELNAFHGVDLHSKIGSKNSGVLVSTNKDDIKLGTGTELALAIAPENAQQSSNAMHQ